MGLIFKYSRKLIIFLIVFITFDIIFFSLLPDEFKANIYNNRAHRIKSYYYHHDLRPMASFYDGWGYEKYKVHTNNLGFKDSSNKKVVFKKKKYLIYR